MTEQDLKLLELRNNIIDDFFSVWDIIYDDDALTDLCYLTEDIIYKHKSEKYDYYFDNLVDDIMLVNEDNFLYYNCENKYDMESLISDLLEDIINEHI